MKTMQRNIICLFISLFSGFIGISPSFAASSLADYAARNQVFCNGVVDDTKLIQAAFNDYANWQGHKLEFPAHSVCRATGLKITGNHSSTSFVIDGEGATIKANDGAIRKTAGGWPWGDQVLSIDRFDKLKIKNMIFDGNRNNRPLLDESGNMVLHSSNLPGAQTLKISDSSKLKFKDIQVLNAVVDGVYIFANRAVEGADGVFRYNEPNHIKFKNLIAKNSARSNVTIINCHDCGFDGGEVSGTHGHPPEDGFDLEPNPGQYDGQGKALSANTPDIEPPITNTVIENMFIRDNFGHCINLNGEGQSAGTRIKGNTIEHCGIGVTGAAQGIAISVAHRDSVIQGNTFQDFNLPRTSAVRSLIDFPSDGQHNDANILKNNTFKNIRIPDGVWVVYFHSDSGGSNVVSHNDMKDVVIYRRENTTRKLYWCTDLFTGPGSANIVKNNKQAQGVERACWH